MNRFSSKLCVFLALGILFFVSGCATTVNISEDLAPSELIQRAQEASDRNRYNVALQYYEALLERNHGSIDLVITAEYEIAFIHYKQKKYQQSRTELNSLLTYYDAPDERFLPPQFKRLALIVLDRITEKDGPDRSSSARAGGSAPSVVYDDYSSPYYSNNYWDDYDDNISPYYIYDDEEDNDDD